MIGAGDLNKRVGILSRSTVDDGAVDREEWAEARKVWAKVAYISDGEKYRGGSVKSEVDLRVTIRKTEIDNTFRIEFEGSIFNIKGIKPAFNQREFLELSLGLVNV